METKIATETSVKLEKFLEIACKKIEIKKGKERNKRASYMMLYLVEHISAAITKKDIMLAEIIENWMKKHRKKFRFCTTNRNFYEKTNNIKNNIDRVINHKVKFEPSGQNIDRYLDFILTSLDTEKEESETT